MLTPQWLEECSLEPIPPVDMKTLCIGKIRFLWTSKEMETDSMVAGANTMAAKMNIVVAEMSTTVSIYVEVDEYSENETQVLLQQALRYDTMGSIKLNC